MKKNTFKSCFSLKRHDASAYAAARLCTLIIALFLSGNEAAKAQLIARFEENMADIVNHYIMAAIGDQIDLSDQLEYIIGDLEAN
ncbi:MAG: hypothetical protein V4691_10860, partial [Pseudomonadota bacterium]